MNQVIREDPASRGTETSAEVLVGPPGRMVSNAGPQQWSTIHKQIDRSLSKLSTNHPPSSSQPPRPLGPPPMPYLLTHLRTSHPPIHQPTNPSTSSTLTHATPRHTPL